MNRLVLGAVVALGMLLVGGDARAQEATAPAPAAGAAGGGSARTQTFDFSDELVTGQLVRPDGATSTVRRRGPGISLIRIREHFVPEMLKSVENL